ncbi:family 16 glycosylhydrolase [Sphingorhabdus sp.]|uniref:glycoside hydrolase family 16 protein n=1 Tax=Sphingorhabdus sp. TaxID=1902408 RepID=UPI00391954BF
MRSKLVLLFAMAGMSACTTVNTGPPVPQAGWSLVWSDEFSGTELNREKWRPEESCWGGGNHERQCYTDRPQNIRVAEGFLHLMARKEPFTGPDRPPEIADNPNGQKTQEYTSGKIRTLGLASWKYGKIEFRAKPPKGQGTWPAVWMMPADNKYGGWPRSGEIDILEGVNLGASCETCKGDVGENRMISALHFGDYAPNNRFKDTRVALPSNALPSDDFHIWTLEWGEGLMRFYLDGRKYWELTHADWDSASPLAKSNPVAPFDQPFYIMANLAIGGGLSEKNNDKGVAPDVTPAALLIDWIRIYQCSEDKDKGLACMQGVNKGN